MNLLFGIFAFIIILPRIQAIPWIAEPRPDQQWWQHKHSAIKQNTAVNKEKINIIFYGDSLIEGWGGPAGLSIFEEKFAPLGVVNNGVYDDRTEQLLFRIADGEINGLKPKLVVLQIGSSNTEDSTDDVVRGIHAVIDLLLEKVPTAKILLLGLFPRNDAHWFARLSDINIKISKLADCQKIFFLNLYSNFACGWGKVDGALFKADQVHLELMGYRVWAEVMGNTVNELIQ